MQELRQKRANGGRLKFGGGPGKVQIEKRKKEEKAQEKAQEAQEKAEEDLVLNGNKL